jgi:NAD(P)-dependent dehydrogenase (short-subunit alcohol dehydrogenase family)
MKIAITGHTSGLGAEFKKTYETDGHTVIGFSRSNGYDLRDWSRMQDMLLQIDDCDMFISCAKPDFVQTTILYELWKLWEGQNKIIVNISSILTYFPTCAPNLFGDPMMDLYRTSKLSLNEASMQLSFKNPLPKIMLVKPGHLYNQPITPEQELILSTWVNTFKSIVKLAQDNDLAIAELTLK